MAEPQLQRRPVSARHCSGILLLALAGTLVVLGNTVCHAQSHTVMTGTAETDSPAKSADRDSLLLEVRRLSHLVETLSDSLDVDQRDLLERATSEELVDLAFEDLADVVGGLSSELARLDLKIDDRTFSLRDKDGSAIFEIEVPEDLGERLSEQIAVFSEALLNELPDDVSLEELSDEWSRLAKPDTWRKPRHVIHGDRFKFGDDVEVADDEEIDGSVWVTMGDAEIYGRVDGDVIAFRGDVFLAEDAEVTGQVITVFGTLEQDKDARVEGQVFVVDPFEGGSFERIDTGDGVFGAGVFSLVARQLFFVMVACLVLIAQAVLSAKRRAAMTAVLRGRPAACAGFGFLLHIAAAILSAVLMLTIIGIPLAVLLSLAVAVVALVALVPVTIGLGRRVAGTLGGASIPDWGTSLIGLVVLHLPSLCAAIVGVGLGASSAVTGLDILGAAVKFGAVCFGTGVLLCSRFGSTGPQHIDESLGQNPQ